MNESKYSDLIAKIQRKKKWVIAITIIVEIMVLLFTTPSKSELNGEVIFENEGIPLVVTVLLIVVFLFVGAIAYGIVLSPLSTSIDRECDPEKHLILNMKLNKQKNIDYIYAGAYVYLGNFTEAMKYAKKCLNSSNETVALMGLFNKARCEFLLGDCDLLRQTAAQYEVKLSSCKKIRPKVKISYEKINNILRLMCAISENDEERINYFCGKAEPWNTSKAVEGFVNYMKGISAYKLNDKEEAIYRFKSVKEKCPKTIFAGLSEDYLSSLR